MRSILAHAAFLAAIFLNLNFAIPALRQTQAAPSGTHLDANGWTTFTPSADKRIIYVSSSTGSDSNNGLSPNAAVATIAKGLSRIRNRSADWLLLKAGDTWLNQQFGFLPFSGRSASEPILISSYGTGARPLIETPANGGPAIGSLRAGNGSNIAIVGLDFYAYTRDPSNPHFAGTADQNGMEFHSALNNVLVEDCKFSFYTVNVFQNEGDGDGNVVLRRNVITDNYSTTGHSQGFYTFGVANLVLEQNLFDHNGWNSSVPGAEATIFNHNIYIHEGNGPATLIGNISTNASSHGAQVRLGGTVIDNLFIHNPIGFHIGYAGSVNGSTVRKNVVTEGNDIDPMLLRGWGIVVGPSTKVIQIQNNIVTRKASSNPYGFGIYLERGTRGSVVENNTIYRWDEPIVNEGSGNNVTSPNAINLASHLDPNRTVETYMASLGGDPSLSAFLTEVRKQSRDNWRPQYTTGAFNEYIRAGFEFGSSERQSSGAAPK